MNKRLVVNAFWDEEAEVWVATSDDVPGLVTEAESVDSLVKKLQRIIPELLDANGIATDDCDIPFDLLSECAAVAHRKAC